MTDVTRSDVREFVRILFVCVCWYVVSSSNGVLGKTILSQFPYPMTVTMVQLLSISVWSPPLLKVRGGKSSVNISDPWCPVVSGSATVR